MEYELEVEKRLRKTLQDGIAVQEEKLRREREAAERKLREEMDKESE